VLDALQSVGQQGPAGGSVELLGGQTESGRDAFLELKLVVQRQCGVDARGAANDGDDGGRDHAGRRGSKQNPRQAHAGLDKLINGHPYGGGQQGNEPTPDQNVEKPL
jgi:hypothetical protein